MVKILSQGKIFLYYSLFLSVIGGFSGQWLYSCTGKSENWWCIIPTGNVYYLYSLLGLYVLFSLCILYSFYFDLYQSIFKDKIITFQEIIKTPKEKLKFIGYICLYVFLMVCCIGVALTILAKEANPDWRIEFIFFVILFISAYLPIILIRMIVSIDYMVDVGFVPVKKIWDMTSKRTFSIMITFCFMILLINFVHIRLTYNLKELATEHNYFIVALITDVVGCFLLCNYLAFIMMYFRAIRELVDEKYAILNENEEDIINEQINDDPIEKETTKQSKKKRNKSKKNKKS